MHCHRLYILDVLGGRCTFVRDSFLVHVWRSSLRSCALRVSRSQPPRSRIANSQLSALRLLVIANCSSDLSELNSLLASITRVLFAAQRVIECVVADARCSPGQGCGAEVCAGSGSSRHASDDQAFELHPSDVNPSPPTIDDHAPPLSIYP